MIEIEDTSAGKTASLLDVRGDWPVTHVHKEGCPKCGVVNPAWSWDREMMGWTCVVCGVCVYPAIVSIGENDDE